MTYSSSNSRSRDLDWQKAKTLIKIYNDHPKRPFPESSEDSNSEEQSDNDNQ